MATRGGGQDGSAKATAAVLKRIADVAGVKSDAALARVLSVSHQALSNWRLRGTVPYEAIVRFAETHGCALDYLLLGRGGPSGDAHLMPELLKAIVDAFGQRGASGEILGPAAIVYNRLLTMPKEERLSQVGPEVEYALNCLAEMKHVMKADPARKTRRS